MSLAAPIATTNTKIEKRPFSSVEFVPVFVPTIRRLQTFSVGVWIALISLSPALFFFLCSFPKLWPFMIAYVIWFLWIDHAPDRGGRRLEFVRRSSFWKLYAGMLKTCDLPPDKTYIFGYHPHGIVGCGAVANWATDATGFSQLFPGLKPHLLTLSSNFKIPFYREILMALGICAVSARSCRHILGQGPGNAITIVVGGAAEALSAIPGTADLTLKRRLGFLKLALTQGAHLVPVFSFGENDIFSQLETNKKTRLYKAQKLFQAKMGFTLPVFWGRGVFNYSFGLLPYRQRIVSVVGRPIQVTKCEKPTMSDLENVQSQYIEELTRIWDEYKDIYAPYRSRELNIIE